MEATRIERLRDAVAEVAPTLAGALAGTLGGPLAGAAVEVLRRAVLGEGEAGSDDRLAEVVLAGRPETLLALRRAEHDFRLAVLTARVEAERVAVGDRDGARQREVAVRDRTPALLGSAVVIGFFGVLAVMLLRELPSQAEPAFSIMLGALSTMTAAVVSYYFGASAERGGAERMGAEGMGTKGRAR